MKTIKSILITLIAVLLTGCYTQLQYSHSMKKITDKPKKEAKEYTRDRNGEQTSKTPQEETKRERSQKEYSEYTGEEDYVPLYYKDYEYAERYDDCKCSPYNVYNFYGSSYDWYGYNYRPHHSFRSHLTISPFHFNQWQYRYRHFGHRYHHPGFAFSISWGHPFYHFYDPFYDPYYAYGSHYSISYNYFYFSGSYYSENGGKVVTNRNTRYGPRSIGTDRVVNRGDRSRSSRVSGRDAARVTKSSDRSRSVGTTRTRNVDRKKNSTVKRNRSKNSSGQGTTRSRSRENIQQGQDRDRVYYDRTDSPQRPVVIDRERARTIRSRTVNSNDNTVRRSRSQDDDSRNRFRKVDLDRNVEQRHSRTTFFHRMKSFFQNNAGNFINNNDWGRSGRSKVNNRSSSSSRSSVGRSSSKSDNSSVTRSRSSSGNSRSGSGSSRSRSGDGDSSSGSDRSRGNN